MRLICMGHDLQDNKTLEGQSRTRIGIELEADLARSADSDDLGASELRERIFGHASTAPSPPLLEER